MAFPTSSAITEVWEFRYIPTKINARKVCKYIVSILYFAIKNAARAKSIRNLKVEHNNPYWSVLTPLWSPAFLALTPYSYFSFGVRCFFSFFFYTWSEIVKWNKEFTSLYDMLSSAIPSGYISFYHEGACRSHASFRQK